MADIPVLVAHRGWPARYPENSLEGIAAALDAGACCVEFDVQVTADGVPVVIHDDNLLRTAGVDLNVLDSTCAALRRESVGEPDRFGARYSKVRMPLLEETVALLRERTALVFVEIKRASLRRFGPDRVVRPILDTTRTLAQRAVIISFDADAVAVARKAGFRTGWALEKWSDDQRTTALDLAPEFLFCKIARLPPAPAPLWQGPWTWIAYETGDPALALTLAGRGVDYVETDSIGAMLEHPQLGRKGCGRDG